jgi:hypothetical protein
MARRAKSRGRKGRSPQKGFFLKREKGQQTMITSKFKSLVRKSGEIYALLGVLVIGSGFRPICWCCRNNSQNLRPRQAM